MADRSVVVRLRAETDAYVAGMRRAKDATTEFGREVSGQGKTARADVEAVGRTALVAGAAMAVGFGKMLTTAASFEKEMSGVAAVSGATADEMDRLSEAAIAAGADVRLAGVTASDAARAEAELVKAGVAVSDVLNGALMGSLTLASAGQLDFAKSAEIAAQAMNIFDLSGRDVTHIADVLAAAANKSAADVGQLGDALKQGGLVAAQTGLSLEETVGAIAAFSDNALVGSDAGTSFKAMLQRLTPQSREAQQLMDDLGFSAYDAAGNFIGLEGLAGELQEALSDMTVEQRNSAMATLFGSDAVRAANILYNEGKTGIREYVDAVDDQGAAARMAAIQNDNLAGDVEALGGALESAFIENGSKATGILREITQAATGAVEGFSSLPSGVQTTALGLGALVTAGTLTVGVLGTLYPKFTQAKQALEGMGAVGPVVARNLGRIAGGLTALGGGLAVLTAFQTLMGQAAASGQEWADSLRPQVMDFSSYDELKDKLYEVLEADSALAAEANRTNAPWDADKRAELLAGARGLEQYTEELSRLRALAMDLAPVLGVSKDAALDFVLAQQAAGVDILANDYEGLKSEMAQTFAETTSGTTASQQLGGAMDNLGSEIATVEEKAKALSEAIEAIFAPLDTQAAFDQFNSGLNEMREHFEEADAAVGDAQDRLDDAKQSLNDLLALPADQRGSSWAAQVENARDAVADAEADIQEAIEGTSRSLEGNSEAAIANRDMLDAMARDVAEAVEVAAQDQTMSMDDVMAVRDLMIAQMEGEAERLGLNKDQVGFYTDALRNIPLGELRTKPVFDAEQAKADIARYMEMLTSIPDGSQYSAGAAYNAWKASVGLAAGGVVEPIYRASGGPSGTDTVAAMLTPGEYVMQKSAVDRFGVGFMEALNQGNLSPASGLGSSSVDNSRHVTIAPTQTIVAPTPQRAASDVMYELRLLAAGAG